MTRPTSQLGLAGLLFGLCCACGDDQAAPKDDATEPDYSLPLVLHPGMFVEVNNPLIPLSDGDALQIQLAVQGGQVIYVAGELENLQSDRASLRSRLVNPESAEVYSEDARTVAMQPVPGDPGRWRPDIRSTGHVAHLIVCPNFDARPIVGEEWLLEVIMSDLGGPRSASESLSVTATCEQQPSSQRGLCVCECEPNYTQSCE